MATEHYSTYKRQKVVNIFSKQLEIRHNRNSVNDTDSSYVEKINQQVKMLEIHPAHVSLTFHGFHGAINVGDQISIATQKKNVIAYVNHTTGRSGGISSKLSLSDWWGLLFFMAFPIGICGGLFYSSFSKHGFTSTNVIILSVGIILVLAIYFGMTSNATARKALKELKD